MLIPAELIVRVPLSSAALLFYYTRCDLSIVFCGFFSGEKIGGIYALAVEVHGVVQVEDLPRLTDGRVAYGAEHFASFHTVAYLHRRQRGEVRIYALPAGSS